VARQVLGLQDRTIGLLAEILQVGRVRHELAQELDVLAAARALFYITQGTRIPWANGQLAAEDCRRALGDSADLFLRGLEPRASRP
jgi:hypothetical protein